MADLDGEHEAPPEPGGVPSRPGRSDPQGLDGSGDEEDPVHRYVVAADALAGLRSARRHRRLAGLDVFEVLYRAYILTIVVALAIGFGSGFVGGTRVSAAVLGEVLARGPGILGGLVALGVLLGLRSGARGGPLAVEAADVRILLLSPLDRRLALRGPAISQLRSAVLAGALVGAVAGLVAHHRMPGNTVEWVVEPAFVGALVGASVIGAALVASGRRLGIAAASAIGVALVAWSAADAWAKMATSPFSLLGEVALWPARLRLLGLVGAVVAIGIATLGLHDVGGQALEAMERRARLVGRLRFAATARDLRAVMLLRRQLTQERPRTKPWLRLPPGFGAGPRFAVLKRDWEGFLRWPAKRVARMVLLAVVAGLALRAVWDGNRALVVVGGLALWLAALEAAEPLAEEVDFGDRRLSYPWLEGWLYVRHFIGAVLVMLPVALIALGVAMAFGHPEVVASVGGATALAAIPAAVAGASVSVARGPGVTSDLALMLPDVTGISYLAREVIPPGLAVIGCIPVAVAASSHSVLEPAGASALDAALLCFVAPLGAFAWLQSRGRKFGEEARTVEGELRKSEARMAEYRAKAKAKPAERSGVRAQPAPKTPSERSRKDPSP